MKILAEISCHRWDTHFSQVTKLNAMTALEQGQILFLPQLSFHLLPLEKNFLSPHYSNTKAKNISLCSQSHRLSGVQCSQEENNQIKTMMQRYADFSLIFIKQLFPSYAKGLQMGRTSFRPVEIAGRGTSYRKDDSRLHVDAFPATPNQGRRILRLFTNINPFQQNRIWRVGGLFENVAAHFLPLIKEFSPIKSLLLNALGLTKGHRTEYDHIMLQIHDLMKADSVYQRTTLQSKVSFGPGTSWIVLTDQVSHAAMAGQYVFEQTFYLPVNAMQEPALSPLHILERLTDRTLIH